MTIPAMIALVIGLFAPIHPAHMDARLDTRAEARAEASPAPAPAAHDAGGFGMHQAGAGGFQGAPR